MLALSYKSMLEEIFDDSRWAVDRNDPPTRPLGVHRLHGQQQQGRSEDGDGDVSFKSFQVILFLQQEDEEQEEGWSKVCSARSQEVRRGKVAVWDKTWGKRGREVREVREAREVER